MGLKILSLHSQPKCWTPRRISGPHHHATAVERIAMRRWPPQTPPWWAQTQPNGLSSCGGPTTSSTQIPPPRTPHGARRSTWPPTWEWHVWRSRTITRALAQKPRKTQWLLPLEPTGGPNWKPMFSRVCVRCVAGYMIPWGSTFFPRNHAVKWTNKVHPTAIQAQSQTQHWSECCRVPKQHPIVDIWGCNRGP